MGDSEAAGFGDVAIGRGCIPILCRAIQFITLHSDRGNALQQTAETHLALQQSFLASFSLDKLLHPIGHQDQIVQHGLR